MVFSHTIYSAMIFTIVIRYPWCRVASVSVKSEITHDRIDISRYQNSCLKCHWLNRIFGVFFSTIKTLQLLEKWQSFETFFKVKRSFDNISDGI